jgi:hypothetical protein
MCQEVNHGSCWSYPNNCCEVGSRRKHISLESPTSCIVGKFAGRVSSQYERHCATHKSIYALLDLPKVDTCSGPTLHPTGIIDLPTGLFSRSRSSVSCLPTALHHQDTGHSPVVLRKFNCDMLHLGHEMGLPRQSHYARHPSLQRRGGGDTQLSRWR